MPSPRSGRVANLSRRAGPSPPHLRFVGRTNAATRQIQRIVESYHCRRCGNPVNQMSMAEQRKVTAVRPRNAIVIALSGLVAPEVTTGDSDTKTGRLIGQSTWKSKPTTKSNEEIK